MTIQENSKIVSIEQQWDQIKSYCQIYQSEIDHILNTENSEVIFYLKKLYCALPLSDILNYSPSFFLPFINHALFLKKTISSIQQLPEDIFFSFILYPRVNNESLSHCRSLFFQQLSPRIQNKTPYEQAIEINFWALEQVTYQSTDDRTTSALTVYRDGFGRCGEESTFLINAFRSMGIPARQIYTPRWAHCDDNHAWVEVFIEQQWFFLGACEPTEKLNQGWFVSAASRAIFIHALSFQEKAFPKSENRTSFYASTRLFNIKIHDSKNQPCPHIHFQIQLLNFAEFYPIISGKTDEKGLLKLNLGCGSIQIHLWDNHQYCNYQFNLATDTIPEKLLFYQQCEINDQWNSFDWVAPTEQKESLFGSQSRSEFIFNRIQKAHQIRNEKNKNNFISLLNYSDITASFLTMAYGNYTEILKFLQKKSFPDLRIRLLSTLSKKSLREVSSDLLEDHLQGAIPFINNVDSSIYDNFILSPEINLAPLCEFRHFITHFFSESQKSIFIKNPQQIILWINQNIQKKDSLDHPNLFISPIIQLKSRLGTFVSINILVIAIARTFGIPCRFNPLFEIPEFFHQNQWISFASSTIQYFDLILQNSNQQSHETNSNWSLALLQSGIFKTLNIHSLTWEKQQLKLSLIPGQYRLLTTTRLPNGNQLVAQRFFNVSNFSPAPIPLFFRPVSLNNLLNPHTLNSFSIFDMHKNIFNIQELLPPIHFSVLIWIEEDAEPSKHLLNELEQHQETLIKLQIPIFIISQNKQFQIVSQIKKRMKTNPFIKILFDPDFKSLEPTARKMNMDFSQLPLTLILQKNLTALYANCGYRVGSVDLFLQILSLIKNSPHINFPK